MPKEREIAQILSSGNAKVRSTGTGIYKMGNDLLKNDLVGGIDADLCWYANSNINTADSLIEFRAAARGAPGTDSIIVGSQPTWAVTGQLVDPPGFLFSDSFSGCLWFLFRDSYGSVYGAHSYRQSGRYQNPMPYITRIGGKLLYYFDTFGRFSTYGPGVFGSVICNVGANDIVIDFVAVDQAQRVLAVVDHTVVTDWRHAQIADPNLAGALTPRVNAGPLLPPAQTGLRAKVAGYALKYMP